MDEVGAIYTADAFEKIKEVPDRSVDVILTDPPYNLGQYSTGILKMSWRSHFNNDIAGWDEETFKPAASKEPARFAPERALLFDPVGKQQATEVHTGRVAPIIRSRIGPCQRNADDDILGGVHRAARRSG